MALVEDRGSLVTLRVHVYAHLCVETIMFDSAHADRDLVVALNFVGLLVFALIIAQHYFTSRLPDAQGHHSKQKTPA